MARYSVYLETADDGRCMAHVPDLPGCFVRAPTRDEALNGVLEAILQHLDWLRRHGEPVPAPEESFEFKIAGESRGYGPFDRRSAAALFPPDWEPATPEEIAHHLRLMAYARADLLALVRDLPDEILDWQPAPQSFSIRRLLRHVGNAEKWYVSRIVPPDRLPPEWERDEDQPALPIIEFLEMTRRTGVARLERLTEEERTDVFYPVGWTDHPEEPWTARKVLRRFLEHEREHTGQVQEILAAWRAHLLARLAAERAELLQQVTGLDERTLAESPVSDEWTAKDVLAHVAAWDEVMTERVRLILGGREEEIAGVDEDARNAAFTAERKDWPLERAVTALKTARADFLAALIRLPDEEFHRLRQVPWGEATVREWTEWRARHDAAHTADLGAWRQAQGTKGGTGPKEVLVAALCAAREELLTAAALIPPEARTSRTVCGHWTLKDVLAHLADWEWIGVEGLRDMAAGRSPQVEHVEDIEAWNQVHYEARCDHAWEAVWADLHAAREAFLEALGEMSQAGLTRSFRFPWGPEGTAYEWACIYLEHDRGHARDLRE